MTHLLLISCSASTCQDPLPMLAGERYTGTKIVHRLPSAYSHVRKPLKWYSQGLIVK